MVEYWRISDRTVGNGQGSSTDKGPLTYWTANNLAADGTIAWQRISAAIKAPKLHMVFLCFALTACTTIDKYSFIRYGQIPNQTNHQFEATAIPPLSDVLALNYASSVASILRCKFYGARIAREISSTAQVALAAFAGAGAAFNYSASTVTALGLGSAGIPELQKIFDAKGRAQAYQDAVRLIEEAEIEYLSLNQKPSSVVLTQNGVTLFQRVTSSIHVVEKTLAGNLPSVDDMQKATERMSPEGAKKTLPGTPALNNIPANNNASVQKLRPIVITTPIPPGLTAANDVQAIKTLAGKVLRQLSENQAANALQTIKTNYPTWPVAANGTSKEIIAALLIDTTDKGQAEHILAELQSAKQ
jgi:hypothetical protein